MKGIGFRIMILTVAIPWAVAQGTRLDYFLAFVWTLCLVDDMLILHRIQK
jgi:hypothetical protein